MKEEDIIRNCNEAQIKYLEKTLTTKMRRADSWKYATYLMYKNLLEKSAKNNKTDE